VQQSTQQLAEHDQDQGHRARGDKHRSLHTPLGCGVKRSCDLQERHQRELGPYANQQHRERVDHTRRGD
jgi:hypothetical protein